MRLSMDRDQSGHRIAVNMCTLSHNSSLLISINDIVLVDDPAQTG